MEASKGLITVAMIGSVGALWISLVGLFVLAVTHDGEIATQVANSALALVGAAITVFSTLAGVHVYVNRPQTSGQPLLPVTPAQPAVAMPAADAAQPGGV